MTQDYFKPGDWNATCFQCGRKRKASELKKHWQGYYVCPEHWEARHPQDFVRGVQDVQTPPWVQPPATNTFVLTEGFVTEAYQGDDIFSFLLSTESGDIFYTEN